MRINILPRGLITTTLFGSILLLCVLFAVAKKKSLFDDRPVEIQELTYIIKQDINNLNQQLAQLQEVRSSESSGNQRCNSQFAWCHTH